MVLLMNNYKYLLSIYYMPGTILDVEESPTLETIPAFREFHFSDRDR